MYYLSFPVLPFFIVLFEFLNNRAKCKFPSKTPGSTVFCLGPNERMKTKSISQYTSRDHKYQGQTLLYKYSNHDDMNSTQYKTAL